MSNILIISFAIIALLIVILILRGFTRPKKRTDVYNDYLTALNYLLSGEKQKAFVKLKEVVRKSSTNIDAYIKIGDILRDLGHTERAIKIHRSLTIRDKLTPIDRIEILKSLIKDYRSGKNYDKAIAVCQKLMQLTRGEVWVQEILLNLFEERGDWERAFETRKKIFSEQGKKDDRLLALYKIQHGLTLATVNGREREGRIKFREARKLDKSCAPAYLYLSDSYIRENRLSDALNELKRFINQVPDLSYLAFDRIKDILYQKGNFGEIENIYNLLLHSNPHINSVRFALADIYERKGELHKAIALCKEELEKDSESELAKKYLVKFYAKINMQDSALDLALELIEKSLTAAPTFTCQECGFSNNQPHWYCPQCHSWDSFLK